MASSNPFGGARLHPTPISVINKNGFKVGVNTPPALKSQRWGGGEGLQNLPPYAPRPVWDVSTLSGAPDHWVKTDALHGSYVFGVKPETGLWLDFTQNNDHSHHVAAMISVQGINALTGEKTNSFELKQFPGKTPAQNYLSTNSGATFWLDGFMTEDGVTRQFVFTEDVVRGVAANLIGNDRVQAIGIAFYKSAQPRPRSTYRTRGMRKSATFGLESIEIAAGARIKQSVGHDNSGSGFWEPNPSAVVLLYYVPEEVLSAWVGSAMPRQHEGFLDGIPTGN